MSLPAVSFAAISLIVTPSYPTCLTANTASGFTFQTQAAAAGGQVQFELFFDFNGNGIIDGDEWPVCTQVLVDNYTVGEGECFPLDTNPSSPNITTSLDIGSAYLPVGNYIVRVQNSLAEVATARLCVTSASAPRTVTGTVYKQGTSTPVPNAVVSSEDAATEDFISAAVTNSSGFYTLQMPITGNVEIYAEKYGYLENGSNVTVPPGGISNYNLYLTPADTQITGTVRESGTNNPVWGAEVEAETIDEKETETTTDINGNFTLPVLSGIEWLVRADELPGYFRSLVTSNCENHIIITPTVGGPNIVDFTMHKETAWIEGTVLDEYGSKAVEGALFFANRINTSVPCIMNLSNGHFTNASGQVTVGLEAGDWRVGLCINCHDHPVKVGGIEREMVPQPRKDVNSLITGEHRQVTLKAYYADGAIEGRVFRMDCATPAPEEVSVIAWTNNALNGIGQTSVGSIDTQTVTDNNGFFRLPLLGGAWNVRARMHEWNKQSAEQVITLATNGNDVIESGETITGINLCLNLEIFREDCNDGVDNDGDGLVDCEDLDCANSPDCCQCPADNIPPAGCISGIVTNLAGQPLAGKTVIIRRVSPRPRIIKTAVTDDNGCYHFTDLENGRYRTKVRNCRYGGTKTVDVAGGGKVNDVNFQCR